MPLTTWAMPNAGSAALARHSGTAISAATFADGDDNADGRERNRRRDRESEERAAAEEAAQQRELSVFDVLRHEPLRRRTEAEIDHAADQKEPGPGVDIDAVFEAAEPARQYDLRHERQERCGDADDESRARHPTRQRKLTAVGEQRARAAEHARRFRRPRRDRQQTPSRKRRVLGTNRCQNNLFAAGT